MAEYIDRRTALDALYDADAITYEGLGILENIPAADVRPVKKAHFFANNNRPRSWMFECSNCGMTAYYPVTKTIKDYGYRYCPWCGAEIERE